MEATMTVEVDGKVCERPFHIDMTAPPGQRRVPELYDGERLLRTVEGACYIVKEHD